MKLPRGYERKLAVQCASGTGGEDIGAADSRLKFVRTRPSLSFTGCPRQRGVCPSSLRKPSDDVREADTLLQGLLADGHDLALAPQTLAEFIHIVTDGKRMPQPLTMAEAVSRAAHWWQAAEVVRVFPNGQTVTDFIVWLTRHQLGRKRLLDTMLAATFQNAASSES